MPKLSKDSELPVIVKKIRLGSALRDCGNCSWKNHYGNDIHPRGCSDGMILTEQEMSLIEFKTNVMTPNYLTILQRATKAMSQLWHTFDGVIRPKCESKSVNIEELLSVDFHVVFNKDFEIMGVNAELMDLQNQFLEDNKHLLFFDNEKTF